MASVAIADVIPYAELPINNSVMIIDDAPIVLVLMVSSRPGTALRTESVLQGASSLAGFQMTSRNAQVRLFPNAQRRLDPHPSVRDGNAVPESPNRQPSSMDEMFRESFKERAVSQF